MSIDQVTARIEQIQTQLAQLAGTTPSTADAFATTMNGVSGTDSSGASTSSSTAGAGTTGADVVADAKKYLGVPYVWGGTDPSKGMDCSGLVQRVYKDLGYDLPRVSYDQATQGTAVPSLAQAQPGDILCFGSPVHHVAIYIGGGKMIEEPHTGESCKISDVYETPTQIRRIIGSEAPTGSGGTTGSTSLGGIAARVGTGTPYSDLINQAAASTGVPAGLIAAVAKQESGFNARAVSGAGAQGIMQLMPGTAHGLGVTNSFDPAQAIDGGARLLKSLLTKFGGRVDLALAGYNAGAGAVVRYDGVPPYPETQNYVKDIMSMLRNGVVS